MAVRRSGTNECQGYFSKNPRSGLLCEGLTACPVQSSPHLDSRIHARTLAWCRDAAKISQTREYDSYEDA